MTAFSGPQPPTNLNHELAAGTEGAHPLSQRGSRVAYKRASRELFEPRRGENRMVLEPRRGEARIVRGMPEGHAEVVLYWASVRRAKRAQRWPSSLGFPDQAGGLQESSHLVVGMHTRGTSVCIPEAK